MCSSRRVVEGRVHLGHPLLHKHGGLDPPLVALVSQVLLDPGADRDGTLFHVAGLSVRYTQENKVLANGAHVPIARQHQPALPGVSQHTLHFNAARLLAVDVVALSGVEEEPYAILYRGLALLLRVLAVGWVLNLRYELQPQPHLLHGMRMGHILVADYTQIKVLHTETKIHRRKKKKKKMRVNITDFENYILCTYASRNTHVTLLAVISCLDRHSAVVAIVHKFVSSLGVDLIEHSHGRVLGSPQGRKLPMSLPRHGEEGIATIHYIAGDEVVRVTCSRQGGGDGRGRIEENSEEDVFVFFHGLVHLGGEVVACIDHVALLTRLATRARLFATFVPLVSLLWSPSLKTRKRN